MQINSILPNSYVDGPGARAVVYFQGCPIHCKGCQSRHTWDPSAGRSIHPATLASELVGYSNQITISGGEPFAQPESLAYLIHELRARGAEHIIVYTGYTLEALLDPDHPAYPWMKCILEEIDVLVDGPFMYRMDDPLITYRGSRNQRIIDVWETLETGEIVILNWDCELILTGAGNLLAPIGLADQFAELGKLEDTRRCGQSR